MGDMRKGRRGCGRTRRTMLMSRRMGDDLLEASLLFLSAHVVYVRSRALHVGGPVLVAQRALDPLVVVPDEVAYLGGFNA